MPIQLIPVTDGPTIVLDKPVLLVGRHRECDVRLESVKISRRHCCIAQVNGSVVVRDLGSTNGVRINGKPVLQGRLRPGDELTIANLRWQVRAEAPAPPRRRSPVMPEPASTPVEPPNYFSGEMPVPISESELDLDDSETPDDPTY
jgi:pSer/pThr/pTyr-binding forkhead associated (FHA) protein